MWTSWTILSSGFHDKLARSILIRSSLKYLPRPRAYHAPVPTTQSYSSTCHSSNGPHLLPVPIYLPLRPFSFSPHSPNHRSLRPSNLTFSFSYSFYLKKMMLKAAPAFGLLNPKGENLGPLFSGVPTQFSPSVLKKNDFPAFVVCATKGSNNRALTGVIFEPFEEVKKELMLVPTGSQDSLARYKYVDECEAAINEQINVEYTVSYAYHAMYAYFDRDNVALKGLAKFFKESSAEERDHAEKFMEYQNKRGGKVKLHCIESPPSEFDHPEKGDALHAMELALSLEKLTNEKLLNLQAVADRNNDPQMTDFVESEFLAEQVEAIKKISEYVAQLRRVGKGHGVWHFDQMLLHEEEAVAA